MPKRSIRYILYIVTIITSVIGLNGCTDDPNEMPSSPVERTVLVYMLANNSLGYYGMDYQNLNAMQTAVAQGALNGGNLIVYHVPYGQTPRLIQIRQNGKSAEQKIIKEYPERNSATREALSEVIRETDRLFPAESRGLILWSHASGWVPKGSALHKTARRKIAADGDRLTRSFGDDNGAQIEITELAQAIPDAYYRFIISDICFGGNIETIYQLRDKTEEYIGSTSEVVGLGMIYDRVIPYLFQSTPDLQKVCEANFDFYKNGGYSDPYITTSLIDCRLLDELADEVHFLSQKYAEELRSIDLSSIQYYDPKPPYAFFDLTDLYKSVVNADELNRLNAIMERVVRYKAATETVYSLRIRTHCGLSTYLPDAGIGKEADEAFYKKLDWYDAVFRPITEY